jgi:hypothetical protein
VVFPPKNGKLTICVDFKKLNVATKKNLDKCAFIVFSGTILGFIVSKEAKVMDPKKVKALVNMQVPTTP